MTIIKQPLITIHWVDFADIWLFRKPNVSGEMNTSRFVRNNELDNPETAESSAGEPFPRKSKGVWGERRVPPTSQNVAWRTEVTNKAKHKQQSEATLGMRSGQGT